ncbi:DUF11 domain-containing protein [Marinicella sp. W31]|uniref:DUF11 domain-containing protein n=1 Tax=Marinicella sp. W31 TaxID=3023713 RepID=UPI00375781B4
MKIQSIILCLGIVTGFNLQAQSDYSLTPTPATESMIGIDSSGDDFSIAVGNSGQILHFVNDTPSLVPSGIDADLFNVHIVDKDFAVASGENFVIHWDGSSWNTLIDRSNEPQSSFITPAWSPPEKNLIYYQILDTSGGIFPFHFLCPYDLSDPDNSGFCRGYSKPILEFCGFAGDFKALQTDGSIRRFTQGSLSNLDDPLDGPVFEQPVQNALNLIAAYIPAESCVPGNIPPSQIYAIHNPVGQNNQFYHFNGQQWTMMGSAGNGEILSGMDGTNRSNVVAVGRKPNADLGGLPFTSGVSWHWDGNNWSEETLPANSLGLTDISMEISTADIIFLNGLEASTTRQNQLASQAQRMPLRAVKRRGMSECGQDLKCFSTATLTQNTSNEFPFADLKLEKTLVNPIPPLSDGNPVAIGDHITYAIRVTNLGPDFVSTAILNDVYFSSQLSFVSSDCQASVTDQGTRMTLSFGLTNLAAGQFITCRPIFEVLSIPVQQSGAVGVLNGAEVFGNLVDPDPSNNVDACLIDSNLENEPANRVQCEPELIWFLL